MQNDLISRNSAKTTIALYLAENAYLNETAQQAYENVFKWLEEQPTAYSVESVVEQLEEEKSDALNMSDDEFYLGKMWAFQHAIDIVKAGGTDE